MKLNLIVDGNFILSKNTFSLHKNNMLFGALYQSLEATISNYRKWYPFTDIYFVSDSREKSWRAEFCKTYKSNRKKDDAIDWEFVHNVYREFKDTLPKMGIKLMEAPQVEGDDWVSYIVHKSNESNISTLIVSSDSDIHQIIKYNSNPLWINMMSNELFNKQKIYVPKNYQIFKNAVEKLDNNDIFNLNTNAEFISLLNNFLTSSNYEVKVVDPIEALITKIISGDTSDNISSVWSVTKNGKTRGIGSSGAKTLYDIYLTEFGEPNLVDPDLHENIADLICEKKKLSKSNILEIKENIESNFKIIDLNISKLPIRIINIMREKYGE